MKETLIHFTNRKLIEHWDDNDEYWPARAMVIVAFIVYPFTLFMAWTHMEEG